MKKKVVLFSALLVCCVILSDFIANQATTNASGGPAGNTGSPVDGQNCTACHNSAPAVPNAGLITSNVPVSGYVPGTIYTITASVTGASTKFGFQASPQNASGDLMGTLINTSTETQLTGAGSKYITHTSSGTSGIGSKVWSFNWTAPVANAGNVTFYGAFNVTNSNNNSLGDTIKLASLIIPEALSNNKDITSFKFSGLSPEVIGTINQGAQTIQLTVPFGTNVTALAPTIIHTGNSVSPNSGVANNFSSPQTYTVTAQNSTTKNYVVTVTISAASSKDITSFKFSGLSPEVIGTIDQGAQTVQLTVPFGTNVTALVPTIIHTGAGINPNSGVAHNFSSPQTYTVTAADASTKAYTITVIVTPGSNSKNITSFKFSGLSPEVIGIINESDTTITLTVPDGMNVTALVPTIIHSGISTNPASGVANDFTSPQIYTVTAQNNSSKSYRAIVNIETSVKEEWAKTFEIYPNPVSDKIQIKYLQNNAVLRITIINTRGQVVKEFAVDNAIEKIDVADLTPGIYFIKAETEKGIIIKKTVKQ